MTKDEAYKIIDQMTEEEAYDIYSFHSTPGFSTKDRLKSLVISGTWLPPEPKKAEIRHYIHKKDGHIDSLKYSDSWLQYDNDPDYQRIDPVPHKETEPLSKPEEVKEESCFWLHEGGELVEKCTKAHLESNMNPSVWKRVSVIPYEEVSVVCYRNNTTGIICKEACDAIPTGIICKEACDAIPLDEWKKAWTKGRFIPESAFEGGAK